MVSRHAAITCALALAAWSLAAFGQSALSSGSSGSQVTTVSLGLSTAVGTTVYYVDNAGSDNNQCTSVYTGACQTLQGALNKVGKRIVGNIQINLDAGSGYACAKSTVLDFGVGENGNDGGTLTILGTAIVPTLDGGVATGTADGGAAGTTNSTSRGTLRDGSQVWLPNELAGRQLVISGTGAGTYEVCSNTSDTIVACGAFSAAPTSASTYQIQDAASIISNACTNPASAASGSTANTYSLLLTGINGSQALSPSNANIQIKNLRFNSSSALADIELRGPVQATVRNTFFQLPAGGIGIKVLRGAAVDARFNAYVGSGIIGVFGDYPANTATAVVSQVGFFNSYVANGQAVSGVIGSPGLANNQITISATGSSALGVALWWDPLIAGNVIDCSSGSNTTGLNMASTSFVQSGGSMPGTSILWSKNDISNCTYAINIDGPGFVNVSTSTGSNNTNAYTVTRGGRIRISSDSTMTGTNELTLDGNVFTLANFRLTTPTPALTSDYYSPNSGFYQ